MIRLTCILSRGDHASRCPHCREAAARDRAVRALVAAAPPPPALTPRARDAAYAAAFAAPVRVPPRRWRALVPAGLGLAAAAAAVVVIATRAPSRPPTTRALAAGATATVGHGRVTLTADGVAWQTGATEVFVLNGRVDVEVDPAPHRPFRVRTSSFVVDVLGTVFDVSADSVGVTRGAVRISTVTGEVIVDRLTAGQRWRVAARTAAASATGATDTPPAPIEDEPAEISMDPTTVGAGAHHPRRDPIPPLVAAPAPTAAELIVAARSRLADGDITGARALLGDALAAKPGRRIRADAEALLAESYQRAGEADAAITRYLAVADTYRELATGQAALYSAAKLHARAGRAAKARALFETYLERYPDGIMAKEARAQLGAKK